MSDDAEARVLGAMDSLRAAHDGPWPGLLVLLGSGLDEAAAGLEVERSIDYRHLAAFPRPGVAGHRGRLSVGRLAGVPVTVLHGREHYYENGDVRAMAVPLRALRRLGASTLLMTNAVGSVQPTMPPGTLVLMSDHINLTGHNPLIGDAYGETRFVDMTDAYCQRLRAELRRAARLAGVRLGEGVYACFSGPSFETPAEIRAARTLGADTVGMSVVPETIIARHCGLRVAAISVVTNFAAGIGDEPLGHLQTMQSARAAAPRCRRLIEAFVARHAGVA